MSAYFDTKSLRFLHCLARNNDRAWFQTHKPEYEAHIRLPFQRLLADLQPALHAISPHYRADPANVGGSLYRIHRDTRFASDKSPYKPWQGAYLFHERRRHTSAPGFYLHLQPGQSFIAAGLWHPDSITLRRVRQFIIDNPVAWHEAAHQSAFRRRYRFDDTENLTRAPRGFPVDFPYLEDLKRRNFVVSRPLQDSVITSASLRRVVENDLRVLAPFVDYVCASLDLPF